MTGKHGDEGGRGHGAAVRRFALISPFAPSLPAFRGHLIRTLVSRGIEVAVLAPDFTPGLKEEIRRMGARPVDYFLERTGINPVHELRAILSLVRALRETKADALLGYTHKPAVYGLFAGALAGVPFRHALITGLGYAFTRDENQGARQRLIRACMWALYRTALPGASRVFFQNRDDLADFESMGLIAPGQAAVSGATGVDLLEWGASPARTRPVTFTLAGRLLKEKGVREFAEAARMVKGRHPGAEFLLLGGLDSNPGGIPEHTVRQWVDEGVLEWPGVVSDMKGCLARTSVYVLPSYYREGVPRSTQEAMAAARPVITTDVPGCRETVLDGVNGFLVPPRDPDALARAMERFILEPALIERMGLESRRLAEERFDADKINPRLVEEMVGAAKGHSPRRRQAGTDRAGRTFNAKRAVDLFLSLSALILLSPVLAAAALLVRAFLGSPVLFRQERPGLKGKPFVMLKFRTMTDARDGDGNPLPDAQRLTRLGLFLRRTSIDELPELINVLKGDMSMVGPRPLLMRYLERYSPEQARRHEVKPGITGWAQVNGRNAITWEEKFDLDLWYVDHRSLRLDARIIAMTVRKILNREGINQPGEATMEEFRGS